MTAIKNPNIPAGVYPTADTIITLNVDTVALFNATTQEEVISSVEFSDNRGDQSSNDGPLFETTLIKNQFVVWVGASSRITEFPNDVVLIYEISDNAAVRISNPTSGSGRTHVDGRAANAIFEIPQDYTIKFWVRHQGMERAFEIDPKLKVHA